MGITTTKATLILLASLVLVACSEQPVQPAADVTASATPTAVTNTSALAPAFTAEQLLAQPTTGWLTSGGSLYNQRYSPLASINKSNITQVKAEWQLHLDSGLGPQHSGQGEPVVHDGVIYHVTGQNDVFAISVDSGEILWKYQPALDPSGVVVCCGWAVRGLALGEGLVFCQSAPKTFHLSASKTFQSSDLFGRRFYGV